MLFILPLLWLEVPGARDPGLLRTELEAQSMICEKWSMTFFALVVWPSYGRRHDLNEVTTRYLPFELRLMDSIFWFPISVRWCRNVFRHKLWLTKANEVSSVLQNACIYLLPSVRCLFVALRDVTQISHDRIPAIFITVIIRPVASPVVTYCVTEQHHHHTPWFPLKGFCDV